MSVTGTLEGHWRVALEERLYEGFARSSVEIVSSTAVANAVPGASECKSPDCYKKAAGVLEADYLVAFSVEVEDRDFATKIAILDGATGDLLLTEADTCEMCGVAEVGEIISSGAAALTEKVDALLTGPPFLVVQTLPAGATVRVDGDPVGKTPLRVEITPGIHEVYVERKGSEPRRVKINAQRGVEEQLDFKLAGDVEQQHYMRAWGWTMVAMGGVGVIVGGALLGIDERPFKTRCTGADVDDAGRCRFRYDTLVGGTVVTAVGAAAIGTGIALLVISRKRKPRKKKGKETRAELDVAPLAGPVWGTTARLRF